MKRWSTLVGRFIMLAPVRTVSTESRRCPLLTVQPCRGMVDEKIQIIIRNLLPNQEVTLHSLHQSEDKDFWEAFGHYISDKHGKVTVANDVSLGGTYEGTEQMGLLWSLRPVPGSRPALRLRKKNVLTPMVVNISVYSGHLSQGFSQTSALARTVTERWYMAPGSGPYPGVLDLWGGGGGLIEYRSALLASHGFACMALEYLAPAMLKLTDVNNTYFEKAYQILQNHPLVQKDKMAMLGLSFGSAITFSMTAYSRVIKPQCCVCISGSHVVPVDKCLFKVIEDFTGLVDKVPVNEDNHLIHRDMLLPIPSDPALKVDVGRIKCPLLLVNGTDDQNWPTVESAEDIEMIMEKAGNRHLLTVLTYPDAGHLIEPPYTPHFRASNFILYDTKKKVVMLWGGQTKPHAYAQEDSWKKILAFLQEHLYSSNVKAKL
uniref:acyl-CoA thioesterase 14 isoform 2 n=1 Tax=Danio rerio TaxID=7955 RepID=UPI003F66FF11